jgi:hypothetical protein
MVARIFVEDRLALRMFHTGQSLVEAPNDEQQKAAEADCSDWSDFVDFSHEEFNFLWNEMQWCS